MFLEITLEELELHSRKNKGYTHGGDPLGNFNRVSALKKQYHGIDWESPMGTALDYYLKQFDAFMWMMCQHYEDESEGIGGRLGDMSIYTKIMMVIDRIEKLAQEKDKPYIWSE